MSRLVRSAPRDLSESRLHGDDELSPGVCLSQVPEGEAVCVPRRVAESLPAMERGVPIQRSAHTDAPVCAPRRQTRAEPRSPIVPLLAKLETRDAELGAGACAERAYSDYRVVARLSQKRAVVAGGGLAPWRLRVAGRVVWRAWPRRGPFRPVR